MPKKRSSAGGSAMQAGADYQNRVAAWLATRMLAGREGRPLSRSGTIQFIRSEKGESVDDLLVGTDLGHFGFIQAKRKLSLSALDESELASVFSQAVRQVLHASEPEKRPWSRALNPEHDKLLLVTSSESPDTITHDLAIVLKRVSGLVASQALADAAQTQKEIKALETAVGHVDREWKKETGISPTDEEKRRLLALLDIEVLDVESGQIGEREAVGELRAVVLTDPKQEHLAWKAIVSACNQTAILRSGVDVAVLRKSLREDHILLQHEWAYRRDIDALSKHTESTLNLLSESSRIQITGHEIKIEREVVSEFLKGPTTGSFVLVGEPGAGKSGVIHELASRLRSSGHDVICLAVDKVDVSSIPRLRDELDLAHLPLEVMQHWDGQKQGFLLIDALDAARGEAAATAILDFIQQVKAGAKRWSIIASVRKWDLRYSRRLRDLFPATGAPNLGSKFKYPEFDNLGHVKVGTFTDEEFAQCCSQWSSLEALPKAANSQMIELLHVPFNLRIAVDLLDSGMAVSEFASLQDQIGLLQVYWDRRVTWSPGGDERESVLRVCLADMVANRRLQADRSKVSSAGSGPALAQLLSTNVLSEWQANPAAMPQRQILAFGHNLLFDFAAEQLFFPHNQTEFIRLLSQQPDLALVLRPSLHMRMQKLWSTDRDGFWKLVFELCSADNISPLIQSAPLTVLAENAKGLSDVEPLAIELRKQPRAQRAGTSNVYRHLVGVLVSGKPDNRPDFGPDAGPWYSLALDACHRESQYPEGEAAING